MRIKTALAATVTVALGAFCLGCSKETPKTGQTVLLESEHRRTPAEWEPQASVWLQWPQDWEGDEVQTVCFRISSIHKKLCRRGRNSNTGKSRLRQVNRARYTNTILYFYMVIVCSQRKAIACRHKPCTGVKGSLLLKLRQANKMGHKAVMLECAALLCHCLAADFHKLGGHTVEIYLLD